MAEGYEMRINNISYIDESACLNLTNIVIDDAGYTQAVGATVCELDADGKLLLLPGLFDSHVHGCGGFDFIDAATNPNALPTITKSLAKNGVAYVMATLVSMKIPVLKSVLRKINEYVQQQHLYKHAAKIVGIHLEGPFIAHNCRGAHSAENIETEITLEKFLDIIGAAPNIQDWKLTLAPEILGGIDFIKDIKKYARLNNLSVKIFLGHCHPSLDIIDRAIQAGIDGFTHLGNACQENQSRSQHTISKTEVSSHLVQWTLKNPHHCPNGVELIIDGAHLSKNFVSLIHSNLGNKILLISDGLGPTDCADDVYHFGSLKVLKDKNLFYLADDHGNIQLKANGEKTLAGSGTTLPQCIKFYYDWILKDLDIRTQFQYLYNVLVINARKSALSSTTIKQLTDTKNFTIFNHVGELKFSACNGKLKKWN